MKRSVGFVKKFGPYILIIIILGLIFAYMDPETIIRRLKDITLSIILLFIIIYAFDFIIRSVRWKILLNACEATPKTWYIFSLMHSVWFVNSLLPGRIGEAMRLKIVEEEFHVNAGITIGTVIVEHFLDFIVLITLAGISSYSVVGSISTNATTSFVLRSVLAFVSILLLILILTLIAGQRILQSFPFFSENLRTRLIQVYLSLKASIKLVFKKKANFVLVIILSISLWIFETTTIFLITRGIGLQISYQLCLLGASVGYLTFAAPLTPGNLGTFELSTASLLSINPDVSLNEAMIVPLIDRALKMLYLVCLGVPFFLYHGFSISKAKPESKK